MPEHLDGEVTGHDQSEDLGEDAPSGQTGGWVPAQATGLRARREKARQRASRTPPPPEHPRPASAAPVALTPVRQGVQPDEVPGTAPAATVSLPSGPYTTGSHTVPVDQVAPNPRNSRDVNIRPQKIAELARSLATTGQLQDSPVVTRDAYLAIYPADRYPDDAKAIGHTPYVQVIGGRRRAAILLGGQPQIDGTPVINISVKQELAASQETWLEATFAENDDREPLDPIEQARAIEQMVAEAADRLGGRRGAIVAVARKRDRSDAWVHQQLNALTLEPEVQDAMRTDDPQVPRLPFREIRTWHELDRDEQLAKLADWRRRKDPTFAAEVPAPDTEPEKPKISKTRATLRRLGETPIQMARAVRAEFSPEERQAFVDELLREEPTSPGDVPNRG